MPNAVRISSSKKVRPVAPWPSAWAARKPPIDDPRLQPGRPGSRGGRTGEDRVEVSGLEHGVGAVAAERLAEARHRCDGAMGVGRLALPPGSHRRRDGVGAGRPRE